MDLNTCNGELDLREIIDQSKTYLKTPYYKTIPQISVSGPTLGPQYNYSDYDKFCLQRNLEPIFASLNLTFDICSKNIENKMVLCVVPRLNNSLVQMSESTQYKLQDEVTYVCSNLYHLCLLYDLFSDSTYPRGWLCNIIKSIEISKNLNPSFINGRLYLALDEFVDYSSIYSSAFDSLMSQISQLYNTGAIVCDENFAKSWELKSYKNGIYIADWIDCRISNDISLFLWNLMINPVTTIQIPHNLLLYHYLGKVIPLPVIHDSQIQLRVDSIVLMRSILELIDRITNYNIDYTLSILEISSLEIFEDYKIKIVAEYKNADLVVYKSPNPINPLILSVLLKDNIPNFRDNLYKILQ
jgi:hypothetical protein